MMKMLARLCALSVSVFLIACSSDTSSEVVDIKGFRVGMSLAEAIKVAESIAPRGGNNKEDDAKINAEERIMNEFASGKIDADEYNRKLRKIALGDPVELAPTTPGKNDEPKAFAYAGKSTCQLIQNVIPENGPGIYKYGDAVIDCPSKVTFYGVRPEDFRAYFIEDKLVFLHLQNFYTKDEKEFPPAYKALADKYKVTPKITLTKTNLNTASNGMALEQYKYEAVFKDKQNSSITAGGEKSSIKTNAGSVFEANAIIEYTVKDYQEIFKKRLAVAEQAVQKIQRQEEQNATQRLKNDL